MGILTHVGWEGRLLMPLGKEGFDSLQQNIKYACFCTGKISYNTFPEKYSNIYIYICQI